MIESISDIPSPSLLVEKKRLEKNISSMQALADRNKVKLRPHTKTHKSLRIGQMQKDAGAKGITVAKVSEAMVFADAGFDDILIAYPVVGDFALNEIAKLASRIKITFGVDTQEGWEIADSFFADRSEKPNVLLEVNTGSGRCGVSWDAEEGVQLAKQIHLSENIELRGVMTHSGEAYAKDSANSQKDTLKSAMEAERDRILDFSSRVVSETGIDPSDFEISVGSTPSMSVFENTEREGLSITEIRPGTYIYNDVTQVELQAAKLSDCALTALATVVSQHRNPDGTERLFIDAGKKTFTSDGYGSAKGMGQILHSARTMTALPHLRLTSMSEEHGWLQSLGGSSVSVGDRMRIVPHHVCVAVNTQDMFYLVDGDSVLEEIKVDARGKVW